MTWQVINGNNIDILKKYDDDTFDSIVTDPPYGIEFLGKDWDKNTGAMETWQECFRVLKPGGHLLAFSAARTYHHLATNIEMAGFEIRDQLMWLYGSGFPKAQDIGKAIDKRMGKQDPNYGSSALPYTSTEGKFYGGSRCKVCGKGINVNGDGNTGKQCKEDPCGLKYNYQTDLGQQWSGWKTALKPAHEPIVMARKPFSGSTVDNVLEHGVGALNIDASRIGNQGRFPSNVIMDAEAGAILDKQAPKTGNASSSKRTKTGMTGTGASLQWHKKAGESNGISDGLSGASKFFYCPKVSRAERHAGFETKNIPTDNPTNGGNYYGTTTHPTDPKLRNLSHIPAPFGDVKGCYVDGKRFAAKHQELQSLGNNHPTVKPVELMKYLVRLVTPKNGKVLDPFNGSGSTGMACEELGCDYTGIELDPKYVEISNKRISAWQQKHNTHLFDYQGEKQ